MPGKLFRLQLQNMMAKTVNVPNFKVVPPAWLVKNIGEKCRCLCTVHDEERSTLHENYQHNRDRMILVNHAPKSQIMKGLSGRIELYNKILPRDLNMDL